MVRGPTPAAHVRLSAHCRLFYGGRAVYPSQLELTAGRGMCVMWSGDGRQRGRRYRTTPATERYLPVGVPRRRPPNSDHSALGVLALAGTPAPRPARPRRAARCLHSALLAAVGTPSHVPSPSIAAGPWPPLRSVSVERTRSAAAGRGRHRRRPEHPTGTPGDATAGCAQMAPRGSPSSLSWFLSCHFLSRNVPLTSPCPLNPATSSRASLSSPTRSLPCSVTLTPRRCLIHLAVVGSWARPTQCLFRRLVSRRSMAADGAPLRVPR